MTASFDEVTGKAALIGYVVERDGGAFVLKDSDGATVLAASLSKVDNYIDNHVKRKAKALGYRLTTQKVGSSLHELSAGEARAAQHMLKGFMLERKEVVVDPGRKEDTREQREDRARRGGQAVIWVTVLGPDYTATFADVVAFLNQHAGDIGLDDDDVERDDAKRPKVAPPSVQKMSSALSGNENAAAIRARGFGNALGDNKPTKEEADLRRALDVMDLPYYGHERAVEQLSPAERENMARKRKLIQDRLDELVRQRRAFDKATPIDPALVEQRRKANVFRIANRRLFRTNQLSRSDVAADGTRPGLDRGHDWIERNVKPDPDAPDFQAPTPSRTFAVQSKKDAGRRDRGAVNGGATDSLREDARRRRLAEAGPKIKALLAARDYEKAAVLLDKVKKDAGRSFLTWLAEAGIDKQVAQRAMRRAKSVTEY